MTATCEQPGLLKPAELAKLRATVDSSLDQPAQYLPYLRTADNRGGGVDSWGSAQPVPVRIDRPTGHLATMVGDRIAQGQPMWVITTDWDTDFKRRDRLVVQGVTYEVIAAIAAPSYDIDTRYLAFEPND